MRPVGSGGAGPRLPLLRAAVLTVGAQEETSILVCAGVAALGVSAGAGGAPGTTRGATTFDVVEKTTSVGFVDNAPANVDSAGDLVVGASDLVDTRGKQIGTAHWSCVRASAVCGTAR